MKKCGTKGLLGLLLLAAASGCTTKSILESRLDQELRDSYAFLPEVEASLLNPEPPYARSGTTPNAPLKLELESALRLANQNNRSHQTQRERLYLAALDLKSEQRAFGFQMSASLNYLTTLTGESEGEENSEARAEISRVLPTGGDVSINTRADRDNGDSGSSTNRGQTVYSSISEVRVTQPLLAGAGYKKSHEGLIQAERDLVYAVRNFALDQQDFAIEVLEDYFTLLNRKSVLDNTRTNVKQSEFLQRRSEALFKVRLASSIDVLRSQQQALTANNQLTRAESNFEIDKKQFLITLGLPIDTNLEVVENIPEPRILNLNESVCVNLALTNRLDLKTARDRVDDAVRQFNLARNNLLPKVNLFGSARYTGEDGESLGDQTYEDELIAGIQIELPLDKRDEKDTIARAEIGRMAARRNLRQRADTIRVEIIENFSRLKSLKNTIDIQKKSMEIAEKRARDAKLRFENGQLSNRDVVEAENELLDARNAYTQALTDYEVQRIRLMRNMGLLDVDREGSMVELKGGMTPSWEQGKAGTDAKPAPASIKKRVKAEEAAAAAEEEVVVVEEEEEDDEEQAESETEDHKDVLEGVMEAVEAAIGKLLTPPPSEELERSSLADPNEQPEEVKRTLKESEPKDKTRNEN